MTDKMRGALVLWSQLSLAQVEEWDRTAIVNFWKRWYFPANATLYLVGDFGSSVAECEAFIRQSFGGVPAVREGAELEPVNYYRLRESPFRKEEESNGAAPLTPLKQRHEVGQLSKHGHF